MGWSARPSSTSSNRCSCGLGSVNVRVQVRYPNVPIVFCDTRPLAEEWTFRFLGAALANAEAEHDIDLNLEDIQ